MHLIPHWNGHGEQKKEEEEMPGCRGRSHRDILIRGQGWGEVIQPVTLGGHGLPMAIVGNFMNGCEDSPGGHYSRYGLCQKLLTRWVGARAGAGGEW